MSSTSLLSVEKLDRGSPELWPETVPRASDLGLLSSPRSSETKHRQSPNDLPGNIDKEDMELIKELSCLTLKQLVEKVRSMQKWAFHLSTLESRELTRGKFLNVLEISES